MRYINQFNRKDLWDIYEYEDFDRDQEGNIILRDDIEMTNLDPYAEYSLR